MTTVDNKIWSSESSQKLLEAIINLSASPKLSDFLSDVLTEKEILEISARFKAATLLREGASYETIRTETKLSTRTIARISQWLQNGTGGYDAAIAALDTPKAHQAHMSPALAD